MITTIKEYKKINEGLLDIREKSLGVFGVDSGVFLLSDPAYIRTFIEENGIEKFNEIITTGNGEILLSGTHGTGIIAGTGADGGYELIGRYKGDSEVPFEFIIKVKSTEEE